MPTNPTGKLSSENLVAATRLVDSVARFLGSENDPRARALALEFLNEAIRKMNMAGMYLITRKKFEYTTSSTPALTDGSNELTLPSDAAWLTDPILIYDGAGTKVKRIGEWIPYEDLRAHDSDITREGTPRYFAVVSLDSSDRTVFMDRAVETDDIAKIEINYFRRLNSLDNEDDELALNDDLLQCVLDGGKAYCAQYRYASKPAIWRPMMDEFKDSTIQAKNAAARLQTAFHTMIGVDEDGILDIGTSGDATPGVVYVRFE